MGGWMDAWMDQRVIKSTNGLLHGQNNKVKG